MLMENTLGVPWSKLISDCGENRGAKGRIYLNPLGKANCPAFAPERGGWGDIQIAGTKSSQQPLF